MVAPWVLERRCVHGSEFRRCLTDWLICDQKATQNTVDACLLLLEESYLLSLPLPPRVVLPVVPDPRNFKFLFRRHVALLLGWTERREEGELHGFSDSVNQFVREIWWPDEAAEALDRAGHCNRQSRALANLQELPPAVHPIPTSDTGEEVRRCEIGVAKDVLAAPVPVAVPASRGQLRSRPVGMKHQPQPNSNAESNREVR